MLKYFLFACLSLPIFTIQGEVDFTHRAASASKGASTEDETNCFQRWVTHTLRKLAANSSIAQTASGPIEYSFEGSGPVVMTLHGGFGGYDQGELVGDSLIEAGFKVLSPSRPGYLRTPLYVGATPEQQADAMVNLMDALGVDQVGVIGYSAGCSVAFQMAVRHPTRVWGLVLECLGGQPQQGPLYQLLTQFVSIDALTDFSSWLLFLATRSDFRGTSEVVLSLDNSLSPIDLNNRIAYVMDHRKQKRFLRKFILSNIPLSPRKDGLLNDIANLDPWQSPAYISAYPTVHTPTLIISSPDDTSGFYPEAVFVSQQIPGAQLITVGNTGHFIWLGSHTKQWEPALRYFLKINKK